MTPDKPRIDQEKRQKLVLDSDYDRRLGSGTASETGYTVEARYNYPDPVRISGQLFDNRWRRVAFADGAIGVPTCSRHQRLVAEHGLLGWAAAQALRWWLHANAEAELGLALCLETRIVEHKIKQSYSIETLAAHQLVSGARRPPKEAADDEP